MNQRMDLLIEQRATPKQKRLGHSTEKLDWEGQLEILFNEAEMIIVNKCVLEPCLDEDEPVKSRKPKQKGKRNADLKNLPLKVIEHTLSEDELRGKFGDYWRRLPDEVYKNDLLFILLFLRLKNIM